MGGARAGLAHEVLVVLVRPDLRVEVQVEVLVGYPAGLSSYRPPVSGSSARVRDGSTHNGRSNARPSGDTKAQRLGNSAPCGGRAAHA